MRGKSVMFPVKATDLGLGDVVQLFDDGYGCATVKQIADGQITFFRPFVRTGDFEHVGGVSCYIGIEEFAVHASPERFYMLVRKGESLK